MNFKTTIVLLVLLAIGGVALFFTRDSGNSPEANGGEATATSPTALIGFKSDDVSKVTVTPADGSPMVLERALGTSWNLTAPIKAPAEMYTVQDLVDGLTKLEGRGTVTASPSETGLDKPRFHVELVAKNGKAVQLDIGEKTAVGSNLYVRKAGETNVQVASADVYASLEKPASDYRRKQLFNFSTVDARELTIERKDSPTLHLTKRGEQWEIAAAAPGAATGSKPAPTTMLAEASEVSDVLMALSGLQAIEFASPTTRASDDRYQFNDPALVVSAVASAEATTPATSPTTSPTSRPVAKFTATFGRYDDVLKKNIFVKTSDGVVAKVATTSLDSFRKTPLDLRDRKVLQIDPASVQKITIDIKHPATTRPTTRAASSSRIMLTRAKTSLNMGPALPTTVPATGPASQPATAPSEPPSAWRLTVGDAAEIDASDARVTALLDAFHPLKATKYLAEKSEAAPDATSVVVTFDTTGGTIVLPFADAAPSASAEDESGTGTFEGVRFEAPASLVKDLQDDFSKSAPPKAGGMNPGAFPMPGMPGMP